MAEDEKTPAKSTKAVPERVGSAGSTGDSVVWECSLGDFTARDGTDVDDLPRDGNKAVLAHIAAEH
jgi:hypothetical protein